MQLPEFLVYIHNGAYAVAQELFLHELTIEDRRNLRLVCRGLNSVVLDYPIVTTLHISTHNADLEYVERISKNERLFRHITTLSWDHSLHEFALLDGDMYKKYAGWWEDKSVDLRGRIALYPRDQILQSHVLRAKPTIDQWANLARNQQHNLQQNRDIKLLMKILPLLTNIERVTFTAHEFEDMKHNNSVAWSPAMRQWAQVSDQASVRMPPPIAGNWLTEAGYYFSPMLQGLCFNYISRAFPLQQDNNSNNLEHHLPVRGINFFNSVSRYRAGQPVFPKLAVLEITNVPYEFLTSRYGKAEFEFFQASTRDLQRLELAISDAYDVRNWDSVGASILHVSSSLQCLTVSSTSFGLNRLGASSIYLAIDIIPRLTQLSRLTIVNAKTQQNNLDKLAGKVRASRSLKELFIVSVHISNVTWSVAMDKWKRSGNLNKLDKVQLEGVTDSRTQARGEPLFSRPSEDKSAVLQWLRGASDLYPLFAQRQSV